MVLHNPTTDAPIPGFPGTITHLNGMQDAGIDNVLTVLNIQTNGTVPQRRQRLKVHIRLLDEAT